MTRTSFFSQALAGAALCALLFAPSAAQAMGSTGTAGQTQTSSYTYNDPALVLQGGDGGNGLVGGTGGAGLAVVGTNTIVTINAGSFTGGTGGPGNIFDGTGGDAVDFGGSVTGIVNGGNFAAGQDRSGRFAGSSGVDFFVDGSGSVTINGQFSSVNNKSVSYADGSSHRINSEDGTFMATLANNTVAQLYSYSNFGTLTLHQGLGSPAAVPEPSQMALFSLGILGLGALAAKARRKQAA